MKSPFSVTGFFKVPECGTLKKGKQHQLPERLRRLVLLYYVPSARFGMVSCPPACVASEIFIFAFLFITYKYGNLQQIVFVYFN